MDYEFNLEPRNVTQLETKNRKIATQIPVPESIEIIEKSLKYQPLSMSQQLPAIWDRAVDSSVYDPYGNKWIDFSSSIFVNNVGHGNEEIVAAIEEYIRKPLLCSYGYYTETRADFAQYIIENTHPSFDKVCFFTTGAETTECSLKISRTFGMRQNPEKTYTIAYRGGFHGKTMGAQTMSGNEKSKYWIPNKDPNIFHLPFPSPAFVNDDKLDDEAFGEQIFSEHVKLLEQNRITPDKIAGFIFEPYQGWGALFFPIGYIKAMRRFADKNKCLLVADEVQSGFGRTGKLFGYEHYDIVPDIICCGKAVSGALPLSAVISRSEILEGDASVNSTHGGNPICCASSHANLKYLIDNKLPEEAARKGLIVKKHFERLMEENPEKIKAIHGKGLAYAALVVKKGTEELDAELVDRIIERAFEKGLMSIRTMVGTIKIGPPLTISDEALIEGLEIISEAFGEIQ